MNFDNLHTDMTPSASDREALVTDAMLWVSESVNPEGIYFSARNIKARHPLVYAHKCATGLSWNKLINGFWPEAVKLAERRGYPTEAPIIRV